VNRAMVVYGLALACLVFWVLVILGAKVILDGA
jgi:hypothetical protein